MPVISTTGGREFEAAEGETLLDAALKAGITLGYSCRTGRCSTCQAQVETGTTAALHDQLGLTDEQLKTGWILTCVSAAETDVTLRVEDLGSIQLPRPKTVPCRINSLEQRAPDVLGVTLRLPPNNPFEFIPGQYVEVIGPGGVRRSYSLANAPKDDHTLELHVRHVPGGAMSDYWFEQAKPHDLLRLYGPLGTFFLRDANQQDIAFLATGTGIAPVVAILDALAIAATEIQPRSVSVYWGGRTPADLYLTPPAHWPTHWTFTPVVSRPDESWGGAQGYVQQALLADRQTVEDVTVYACGSDDMIHSARTVLVENGLDEHRFFSDAFVSSAPV